MKTDQLIEAMVADIAIERPVERVLPVGLLIVAAVVGGVFLLIFGRRDDSLAAFRDWTVAIKQVFPVILAVGGFGAVLRLARPGETVGKWPWLLAVAPFLVGAAVAVTLAILPRPLWNAALMGKTHIFCLFAIPLISLPILGISLWALGRGASTRPSLSGAVAGIMSGGTGTALYTLHCPEDSPLFYGTWYVLGILVVTLVGALAGRRYLRW